MDNIDREQLKNLLEEYLRATIVQVRTMAYGGLGKEILGAVINRPEDVEIGIDRVGEKIIRMLLEKLGLHATIFSEPENGEIQIGEKPNFYGSLDPFDGSVLFLKGFEHNWYTVLGFFDLERNPLCCGIGDILNEKAWIFDGKENFLLDLKHGSKIPIAPSQRKILGGPIVLASYIMSSEYFTKFFHTFWKFVNNMHPRALLYPNGGSCIYGYLAEGKIDAYVMFDEPRSEIDPGFAIAKAAGCQIGEVDETGNWKEYEFLPGKQHDKVGFFIAACTKELRDELINYYKFNKPT